MLVEIPDIEIMIPAVKERKRLQSVRAIHLISKIIDDNKTEDGYTWKTITDEEIRAIPLPYLWAEYESSFKMPSDKVSISKCIVELENYVDFETGYTYESLMESSLECLYSTYITLRSNASMLNSKIPSWKELVDIYDKSK